MFKPPIFPVELTVDNYHGTKIEDSYRYLEDLSDRQVQKLIKKQAEYADNFLAQIPYTAKFLERILELENSIPTQIKNII